MDKTAILRAALAAPSEQPRVPLGHPAADLCLQGGLVRGALHEVFAESGHEAAATGFVAGFAARVGGTVLWIRQDFSAGEQGELAATGFLELGLDPSRLILLRVPDVAGVLRAAADALTCAALGAVVIELLGTPKVLDFVAHRRLALGAAAKGVTAFLLRFGARPDAGAAETRWLVRAAPTEGENWGRPAFEAHLTRHRHGATGHWVMEWSCDHGLFAADSGAMVSASSDGPDQVAAA